MRYLPTLAATALLSACVAAPPPPPEAAYERAPNRAPPSHYRHVHHKPAGGGQTEVASACPWPAHARASAAHLETAVTQVPMPPGTAPDAVEGCAVLRFGIAKAGTVTYIEVVNAKPDTAAPVALKSLLAARFKPSAHDEDEALIRVQLRSPQPDLVAASLKLR